MEQIPFYGDERQVASCIYCGSETSSRDHVPCKVLLDEPYPANLPCVPACQSCNGSASLDEEYVACLIECAVFRSTTLDTMIRPKVRRILEQKPSLFAKVSQAQHISESSASFQVELDRIRNVMLKLARGHVCYELNELERDEPQRLMVRPLSDMDPRQRHAFETGPQQLVWPEVGSRAMSRMVESEPRAHWLIVQPGRYRYMTWAGDGVLVRIVAGDYLACEVFWE